jgi:hypothetical protein
VLLFVSVTFEFPLLVPLLLINVMGVARLSCSVQSDTGESPWSRTHPWVGREALDDGLIEIGRILDQDVLLPERHGWGALRSDGDGRGGDHTSALLYLTLSLYVRTPRALSVAEASILSSEVDVLLLQHGYIFALSVLSSSTSPQVFIHALQTTYAYSITII